MEFINLYMTAYVTVGFGGFVCFYILGKLGFDRDLSLDSDLLLLFEFLFKELQAPALFLQLSFPV